MRESRVQSHALLRQGFGTSVPFIRFVPRPFHCQVLITYSMWRWVKKVC